MGDQDKSKEQLINELQVLHEQLVQLREKETRCRKMEEALRESEERFRMFSEASFEGIVVSERGKIVDGNEQFANMFGYTHEEIIGMPVLDFVAREDRGLVSSNIRSGYEKPYEHKALKKDGCIFPVEVRGKCISSHGRKMRITAIRDISEHKEAEEALRRSEATNKAFLSAIPDLMFRISKDGTCLDFKAAKDIETLIPPNEFLGKNILEMLPSDVVRKCSKYIELVLKTGETQIFEYQLPIRDQMRDYEARITVSGEDEVLAIVRDVTERKQMEKALRDSEERYRALYEDNPSMYFTVDKHGKVLSVNKFGAEQLGYSVGELVGQSVLKVLYKEDRKAVKERLTECLQKPTELAKWEVRKVHKDGRLLWVREVARAVRDVDGNPIILIVCENITERKLTEQALQRSEERLSAIFNNTPNMAIESFDLNGRVLSWNKAAENIFGWTQQEALGKTLDELILNKDSTKEFHRIIKQINKTNKPYGPSEWEFSDKDGNKGIAYSTLFPISTGEGNKEFICMDVDITERKQAEEALRRSEERFRDLFDNAPDMYIILDPDSKIVDFNQRGLKQLGYKSNQVIGKSISNFIHPEDLEKVGMVMTHIQKTGEPPENIEVRLLQENGQALWVSKEVSLLKNDVGELQAILVVCRNITGHKRLQKELARAQRLETAGRVAGQIAHDFNNLLAPLTAYPTLMREELRKNHPILEMVDEIESAANKIAEINQQLLALGRRGHYSMESFDLNDLVQNLILSLNLPQELVVNLELDSNLLLIKGGIAQLTRALTNLIMNAKEAMQGSGVLTIKTSNVYLDERLRGYQTVKRGEYVKLEITDNGTGIASGILDKIFDPFFTTKKMDRMRGSGLGLSVVHGIIEDHKGYITVESSVGKGTTFSLYFPVSRDFERELADAIEKTRGGKEKILVVDDDPVQRRVAAQLLRYLGYKVHTVSSGEQAVKYVKKHPQDLLLLDMVMDGIDGTETYRQILNFKPDQKTIILSGYAMSQRVVEALRLGAGSFVSKPVTLNTLATTVRKELDRKRKKSVPGLRNDKS